MLGNFLSCRKGVKDPVEVPEVSFDWPRDPSAEMGLILPGGENLLDFLELRQVLPTYDGDVRDPLWWLHQRPVPMPDAGGLLLITLLLMPGPNNLCGSGPEPEVSSAVLTWILGFFWSLTWRVNPPLK